MRLTNFEVRGSVVVFGFGRYWDLHNRADLDGMELLPETEGVRLRWRALEGGFEPDNPARWVAIRFDGVSLVTARRIQTRCAPEDARTVSQLVPPSSEETHFVIHFMKGFDIEIAATEATLESESPSAESL